MKKNIVVFCVCQGDCPFYKKVNLYELVRKIRKTNLAYFVTINLKLCEKDGLNYLETLIKSKDINNIIISACNAENQSEKFIKTFKKFAFIETSFHPIEVQGKDTAKVYNEIKAILKKLS